MMEEALLKAWRDHRDAQDMAASLKRVAERDVASAQAQVRARVARGLVEFTEKNLLELLDETAKIEGV